MSQLYLKRAIAIAIFSLLTIPSVFAATIVVTSTADSGPGTLRQAVADAAPGDEIRFFSKIINMPIMLLSEIEIDKELMIRGIGIGLTTINGGGGTRAFNVTTDADVRIRTLTITNCSSPMNGGAIMNPTGQLWLDGVLISESSAGGTGLGNGGGAVANSGTLFVTTSQFINNSATGAAGSGGAIISTGGTFSITGTTFTGNTAMRAGGAIEMAGDAGSGRLVRVTMTGNSTSPSPGNGGGVHITGPSNLTVIDGTYSGNTASREGGALWNGAGTMVISRALIDGNTASGDMADDGGGGVFNNGGDLQILAGTVISNNVADGASGSGGGVFNADGGSLRIIDATITGNTANRAGGGIEDASGAGSSFSIANTAIDNNETFTSPGNGGGIHISGDGSLGIFGGTINNNTAGAEGGGVWNNLGTTVIFGTTIAGNTAAGNDPDQGGGGLFNNSGGGKIFVKGGAVIRDNSATGTSGSGGGILNVEGGELHLLNVSVINNTANRAGGGIEDASGAGTLVIIQSTTIDSNEVFTSPGNGGGIHVGGDGRITFRSGMVRGNTAGAEGGGIWIGSGRLDIGQNVVFDGNVALGNDADQGGGALYSNGGGTIAIRNGVTFTNNSATGTAGSGGAILNNVGASLTMDGVTFEGNVANRAGGAIEDVSGDAGFDGFTIKKSIFNNNIVNTSPGNGGAIHITGAGDLSIVNGSFSGNTAGSEGGGVWNGSGTMRIIGSTFDNNDAMGAGGDNGGGAIFNNGGTMNIIGITAMGNTASGASGSGGALLSTGGMVTVLGSTFSGNTANRAGGAVEQIDGLFSSSNNVYDANIVGSSPGNGGAFHVTGMASTVLFTGGSITNNSAGNEGGGVWNQSGTTMTIDGVAIMGNTVTGMAEGDAGGGVFNNGGMLDIMSSTIANNTVAAAMTTGGGIFNKMGGDMTLTSSTVSGNSTGGNGGGIANDGIMDIVNSTIAFNTAMTGGGISQDMVSASLSIKGSILSDNTGTDSSDDLELGSGGFVSNGFNLVGSDDGSFLGNADDIVGGDADLGPLADNGGNTMTHAIDCDSDASDAGDDLDDSVDQIGQAVVNTRDIGSFEGQEDCMVPMITSGSVSEGSALQASALMLEEGVNVFPNPATGNFTNVRIPTDLEGETIIRLIDATGRVKATRNTRAGGIIRLPLGEVNVGTYTVQVINGDNVTARRIIKTR